MKSANKIQSGNSHPMQLLPLLLGHIRIYSFLFSIIAKG